MSGDAFAPVLLVSMPQMLDPNFARTVVLLAEYGAHGAFGLVVNRQMSEPAREVITPDPPIDIQKDVRLFVGGPVEPNRAWVLAADKTVDDEALEVVEGVYLSAAPEVIKRALQSAPHPRLRLVVGYAGWGAGQLDGELAASAWLMARCRPISSSTFPSIGCGRPRSVVSAQSPQRCSRPPAFTRTPT